MKIVEIIKVEDCFTESSTLDILLSGEISKEFIYYLGKLGKLHYFGGFARPFFKITANEFEIKGVEKNKKIRVLLIIKKGLIELEETILSYSKQEE